VFYYRADEPPLYLDGDDAPSSDQVSQASGGEEKRKMKDAENYSVPKSSRTCQQELEETSFCSSSQTRLATSLPLKEESHDTDSSDSEIVFIGMKTTSILDRVMAHAGPSTPDIKP
jgi:hypothetical protein